MSLDNTKYDIELNGVGHRIKGYKKSEANAFVPRLGSGDQTESEFDLLRSTTLNGFAGGMLQRNWDDDTSVYAIDGLYPKYNDGVLYSVNEMLNNVSSGFFSTKMWVRAWVATKDILYVYYEDQATAKGKLVAIARGDHDGNVTATTITIPDPDMTQLWANASLVIHSGNLWFSGSDGNPTHWAMFYMDATVGTSMTKVPAGSAVGLVQMVSYKGSIYGLDPTNTGILYKYTGDTSTMSETEVGRSSTTARDDGTRLFVYNNRIVMTRFDGMWTYDTVTFSAIDDLSSTPNALNYRCAVVWRGYVYYYMSDGLYRYNGSLIEKIYDSGETGVPVDMQVGSNRLLLLFVNSRWKSTDNNLPQYTGPSRLDISTGNDFSANNNVQAVLLQFNGSSMYGLRSETYASGTTISNQTNLPTCIIAFDDNVWTPRKMAADGGFYWTSLRAIDGDNSEWSLYTSIFDAGFPQLTKSLENIEGVFDGNITSDYQIDIYYRTTGFEGSGSWTLFGTMKMSSLTRALVFKSVPAGVQFQRIQFRFQSTETDFAGISKLIIRTSLMPDLKYQWQFTVLAYGDDTVEPLLLADGSEDTQGVSTLRGNIYAARDSKVPIIFVDLDQLDLNGAHTNVVTTITLNDSKLLKAAGFVKIDNEVIYYTAKTNTTLTGCVRGALGTTAASHLDNAKIFPAYRAVLRQIVNEYIEMTDKITDQTEDKQRASELTILLQEQ